MLTQSAWFRPHNRSEEAENLFLVGAGSLLGFTIYVRLLREWGAFRAGLYAFVSPVIAVTVGVVVLGERFGWAEGVGAVLMFGAAAIALKTPARG